MWLLWLSDLCTKFRCCSLSSEPVLREDSFILGQAGEVPWLPSQ